MNRRALSQFLIGCCAAVALAAAGCSSDNGAARTNDANRTGQPAAAGADRAGTPAAAGAETGGTAGAAGTSGTSAADKDTANAESITLTGCLQKGSGALRSDYVLTEVNTTRGSVGTTGANPKPDAVGQEQMRQAEHSYRLDGDRDDLDKLVGKQVRVNGTIEKRSDLNDHNANGTVKDRDREKISDSDLAQVKVASVSSIADACGKSAPRKR